MNIWSFIVLLIINFVTCRLYFPTKHSRMCLWTVERILKWGPLSIPYLHLQHTQKIFSLESQNVSSTSSSPSVAEIFTHLEIFSALITLIFFWTLTVLPFHISNIFHVKNIFPVPHNFALTYTSNFFVQAHCKKFSTEIPLHVFPEHTLNKKFPRLRY